MDVILDATHLIAHVGEIAGRVQTFEGVVGVVIWTENFFGDAWRWYT